MATGVMNGALKKSMLLVQEVPLLRLIHELLHAGTVEKSQLKHATTVIYKTATGATLSVL